MKAASANKENVGNPKPYKGAVEALDELDRECGAARVARR